MLPVKRTMLGFGVAFFSRMKTKNPLLHTSSFFYPSNKGNFYFMRFQELGVFVVAAMKQTQGGHKELILR